MSLDALLEGWPVRCDAPVAWGQMDAFQHVNNTVYFRWFEDARLELFTQIGWLEAMGEGGVGPILARTQCVFKRPLSWPDTITVAARVEELGEDRFTMRYRVVSHALEAVAAEGDARVISYDYGLSKKAPIPASVRKALSEL